MEFQQGQNYMHCISLCCGDKLYKSVIVFHCAVVTSCTSLSLYFIVVCTHLSRCDCRGHAVGQRCMYCDVLFTLTILLLHILKRLESSQYKFTLTTLSQHICEKFGWPLYGFYTRYAIPVTNSFPVLKSKHRIWGEVSHY